MKIYIVTEGRENIIRFATLNKKLAEDIKDIFHYMGLEIKEFELLGA